MSSSKKKNRQINKLLDDLTNNSLYDKPSIEEIAKRNKMTVSEVISYKNDVMNDAETFAQEFINNEKNDTSEDDLNKNKENEEKEEYEYENNEDDDEDDLSDFAGHSFYQTPTDDTIKHKNMKKVWIITFVFVAISIVLILFVPKQQNDMNPRNKVVNSASITKDEKKDTPKPSISASPKNERIVVISLYKSNVEVEYGKEYDPKTNIKSIKDQNGKNVNDYTITGKVNVQKSGDYKITVSVPTDNNKFVGKMFIVTVKEKPNSTPAPTPTPKPTPTPEQKKSVQQPVQRPQSQPVQKQQPIQKQVTPAQPAQPVQKPQQTQKNQQPQAVPEEESSLDIG